MLRRCLLLAVIGVFGTLTGAGAADATSRAPEIVGGTPASPGSWPWLAFVANTLPNATGVDLCSGTVVAPNVVLTAGHCAVDPASMTPYPLAQFSVVTGSLDWTDATTRQVSAVIRTVAYPGFLTITGANGEIYSDGDAALLELGTPTTAPAITLATDPEDGALYTGGTPATIAGWGLTAGGGGSEPTQLQWANTVVQDGTYCAQQANDQFAAAFDSSDQICAIDSPSDSAGICQGDSGGPIVATRPDGTPVEIAITSWSASSCTTQAPDFFTRTDVLSSWISQWLAAMAPPAAATLTPGTTTESSAQLNGTVDPNGTATSYDFQWGATTAYGNTTPANSTGNGSTALAVNAVISGLSPSTTYHYRLTATNFNGTVYGADQTLTTASPPPSPRAGRYRGHTSQGRPITLRVASNEHQLIDLTFSLGLRCTNRRHRHLAYTISPLAGTSTWTLGSDQNLGFADSFTDRDGTRYTVSGTFSTTGSATGTLSAHWRTHEYGTCRSGRVTWSAHE